MTDRQLDLFETQPRDKPAQVERFGVMDARCGLPLRNEYSSRLPTELFRAYELGYSRAIAAAIGKGPSP